jgi:hypothetical protein
LDFLKSKVALRLKSQPLERESNPSTFAIEKKLMIYNFKGITLKINTPDENI